MKHSFKSILQKTNSKVYGFAIPVPAKIGNAFKKGEIARLVVTYNHSEIANCAFMPGMGDGYWLVINKKIRTKLKLDVGSSVDVMIQADTSKYGMPMPEEMEELLIQDPEGNEIFHKLTPGKQRSLLYIIGKIKSSDIRLRKAVAILEYLKMVNGNLDFPEMNEFIKDFKI